jgi:hypothetical protein
MRRKPGTDTKFPAQFAGNWLSVPGFAPRDMQPVRRAPKTVKHPRRADLSAPATQSGITVISDALQLRSSQDRLYSVIFEAREDEEGEILHLVTLWRSTKEEIRLYEENS